MRWRLEAVPTDVSTHHTRPEPITALFGATKSGSPEFAARAVGYGLPGLRVDGNDNLIGGPAPHDRNLISGNSGDGIDIWGLLPGVTAM